MGPTIVVIIGYTLNAVGTILMVRYGLPYQLPVLGLISRALSEKEASEDDRRHMTGAIGFVLLLLGTLLQIVSAVLR